MPLRKWEEGRVFWLVPSPCLHCLSFIPSSVPKACTNMVLLTIHPTPENQLVMRWFLSHVWLFSSSPRPGLVVSTVLFPSHTHWESDLRLCLLLPLPTGCGVSWFLSSLHLSHLLSTFTSVSCFAAVLFSPFSTFTSLFTKRKDFLWRKWMSCMPLTQCLGNLLVGLHLRWNIWRNLPVMLTRVSPRKSVFKVVGGIVWKYFFL